MGVKYKLNINPPKYDSPEQMREKLTEYFDECDKKQAIPSIAGMALFLGFADKQSIYDYEKRKVDRDTGYACLLKKARLVIESVLNDSTMSKSSATGAIFRLKCNYGYKETQVVENKEYEIKPPDMG